MINPPKTRAEAEKCTYGNERQYFGVQKFNPDMCAYEICLDGEFYQCSRKPGHGPDDLYCKQHAKIVEKTCATK